VVVDLIAQPGHNHKTRNFLVTVIEHLDLFLHPELIQASLYVAPLIGQAEAEAYFQAQLSGQADYIG